MTNEQINIAIAELTGLDVIHDSAGPKDRSEAWKTGFFTPKAAKQRRISWPSSAAIKVVPNYCNDQNAMHEAVTTLPENKWVLYGVRLAWECGHTDKKSVGLWHISTATAYHRAVAFLKTLEKWEETK